MQMSKLIKGLLIVEACVFIAPAVVVLVAGAPVMMAFYAQSKDVSQSEMLIGYSMVLSAIYAIYVLISLIDKTYKCQKFKYDVYFWLAAFSGSYAAFSMYQVTNVITTLIVVLPLVVLVIHFIFLQKSIQNKKTRNQ